MKDTQRHPDVLTQSIGDTLLTYLLYEGKGPTLVMLHATGFLPWLWHPIARSLSSSCRVIAPYFCDHRESDPDEGGLNWMTLAGDFSDFCGALKVEKPFLVGHSMGATVLTIAAALHDVKPAAMVLIEPIFLPRDFYSPDIEVKDHPLAAKSIQRRNQWRDASEARDYLQSRTLFKPWDEEMLSLYIQHGMRERPEGGLELSCSPRREAALFMGGVQYDPWPLLPRVTCPVLVIEGEQSDNRHFIDLKKITSLFPDATHRMIRNAGHLVPMEKPAETTAVIREFFRLVPGMPDSADPLRKQD